MDELKPWHVIEPITGVVLAECETEELARSWVLGARSEHRNAGHVAPSYRVAPNGVQEKRNG